MHIPPGWRQINDVCIGAGKWQDGKRERPEYTVFVCGGTWEAWHRTDCLAFGLADQQAAIERCREHRRTLKGG